MSNRPKSPGTATPSIPGRMVGQSRRNGLPESIGHGYVHPGWTGGVPSMADFPRGDADTTNSFRCPHCGRGWNSKAHARQCLGADVVTAVRGRDGACKTCGYPYQSPSCVVECGEVL